MLFVRRLKKPASSRVWPGIIQSSGHATELVVLVVISETNKSRDQIGLFQVTFVHGRVVQT